VALATGARWFADDVYLTTIIVMNGALISIVPLAGTIMGQALSGVALMISFGPFILVHERSTPVAMQPSSVTKYSCTSQSGKSL
jgi:hypothetical protein